LRGKERERVQQIGGIAHRLEALSKQLGICIILLSQLRRNMPNDPAPKLEELKESGDIADAADSIYLIYRPERHGEDITYPDMSQGWSQFSTKGTALLICSKNRQGALNGEQLLGFDAATTCFSNINNIDYLSLGDSTLPSTEDVFND
jgi:replicative DNA helicase